MDSDGICLEFSVPENDPAVAYLRNRLDKFHWNTEISNIENGCIFIKRVNINKAPFSPRDLYLKTPSFVKRNTKVGAPLPEKCKIEKPQVLYFQFQILGQPRLLYFALL